MCDSAAEWLYKWDQAGERERERVNMEGAPLLSRTIRSSSSLAVDSSNSHQSMVDYK